MTLGYTHATRGAAEESLRANGFTARDGYWAKPSKVDDWYGAYAVTAVVHIERREVTGGPDYWELRFA